MKEMPDMGELLQKFGTGDKMPSMGRSRKRKEWPLMLDRKGPQRICKQEDHNRYGNVQMKGRKLVQLRKG